MSLRGGKFGMIREVLHDGIWYDEPSWAPEAIAFANARRYRTGIGWDNHPGEEVDEVPAAGRSSTCRQTLAFNLSTNLDQDPPPMSLPTPTNSEDLGPQASKQVPLPA